jgi:hypothetical protein
MVKCSIYCDLMLGALYQEFQIVIDVHFTNVLYKIMVIVLHTDWMKSAWPDLLKANIHHNKRKKLYMHRPSKPWFPSYDFLTIKENVESVHLVFPCSWSAARIILCLSQWQHSKAAGILYVSN